MKNKQFGFKKRYLILILSLGLMGGLAYASVYTIHHSPDPCIVVCHDVPAPVVTTTIANIQFIKINYTVTVVEQFPGFTQKGDPVSGITANKIYLKIGDANYYCSGDTDANGQCIIPEVPLGSIHPYELHIDSWVTGLPNHYNIPYTNSDVGLTEEEDTQAIKVNLQIKSYCDINDELPPSYCAETSIKTPVECVPESEATGTRGFWSYEITETCDDAERQICSDGQATVLDGVCAESDAGASCQEADCAELTTSLCSFSTPLPPEGGKFKPTDRMIIDGEDFGNEGGEVRIGNNRIYINANDPRANFSWTDNNIQFPVPYTIPFGTHKIGVRPEGYDFKKIPDPGAPKGWRYDLEQDPDTGNTYMKPIYCMGGAVTISELSDLAIDGPAEINVSVSGGE